MTLLLEFLNHKVDGFQEEVDDVGESIERCVDEVVFQTSKYLVSVGLWCEEISNIFPQVYYEVFYDIDLFG